VIKTLERDRAAAAESAAATTTAPPCAAGSAAASPSEPVSPNEPDTAEADPWPSPFEPGPPVSEAEVRALAAVLRGEGVSVVPLVTPVS
jgi:hypothetical protein